MTASERGESMVVNDPGHGGSNTGAAGRVQGAFEKQVTLAVARALPERLEREGVRVVCDGKRILVAGQNDTATVKAVCRLLEEMGCPVPSGAEIRVWDSSAEVRYLVLPEPPAGTEGRSEQQLAGLVTRDAMIGVALCPAPAAA